jgi:hypothetical protein
LELLEKKVFSFASGAGLSYPMDILSREPPATHDRLFLQRVYRPGRAQRRERRADAAAHAWADLWMSGL